MAALPRATCHACGSSVPVRVGGELREHRANPSAPGWCSASGQLARTDEPAPMGPHRPPEHPACAAFPLLDAVALNELAHDIDAHGLLEPIVMYQGQVLDGRNRLRACELADVEPVFREWEGDEADLVAWVISKNIHRRHLDTSQRAMIAARLATLEHGGDRSSGQMAACSTPTQAEAAALLNVGERTVRRAREVLEQGTPELVAQVERGEMSVAKAAALTRPTAPAAYQRGLDELDRQIETAAPPARVPPSVDDVDDTDSDLDDPFGELADPGPCTSWHPDVEVAVRCEQGAGHEGPHAATGRDGRLVWPLGELAGDTDADIDTDSDDYDMGPSEPEAPLEQEAPEVPLSESEGYDGDSWSTPDHIIETAKVLFGGAIDLDPATNETAQARIQAKTYCTKEMNGLDPTRPWWGKVWLNPPYRRGLVSQFVARLVEQYEEGLVDEALLLVNNCTDTAWCQRLLAVYPACFVAGRVGFLYDGVEREGPRQGQIIFYLGTNGALFRQLFRTIGVVVEARAA